MSRTRTGSATTPPCSRPTSPGDPRRVRRAVRPAPRPAVGGGPAHDRQPRGRGRRPPGRPDLGLPAGRVLPRRLRRHHLAAPDRGQRLPRPAAPREGPGRRPAARRPRGARLPRSRARRARARPDPTRRPTRSPASGDSRVLAALDAAAARPEGGTRAGGHGGLPGRRRRRAILEVPTGTVKSRCARGRARLAVLLADLARPPAEPVRRVRLRPIRGAPARTDRRPAETRAIRPDAATTTHRGGERT